MTLNRRTVVAALIALPILPAGVTAKEPDLDRATFQMNKWYYKWESDAKADIGELLSVIVGYAEDVIKFAASAPIEQLAEAYGSVTGLQKTVSNIETIVGPTHPLYPLVQLARQKLIDAEIALLKAANKLGFSEADLRKMASDAILPVIPPVVLKERLET